MVQWRGSSRGLAAVAAGACAGALCLTLYPHSAGAHEPRRGAGTEAANDSSADLKSDKLHPRRGFDVSRSQEGIRKRLAAGVGTTSIEQDVPRKIAVGQDGSAELQDHAATGTCKRTEDWGDEAPTYGDGGACHEGEGLSGPDIHKDAHQGRDSEETQQRIVGAQEAPFGPDHDRLGLHQSPSTPRERNERKESRTFPPDVGFADLPKSHELQPALEHDPWGGYQVIAQADPVTSWEILREARLSYFTFRFDQRKGRRQLGILPTDVARILPEAFSTFNLPVMLPNGSRSRVEGVPNIDWTCLFAHTVAVTQELNRRYDALDAKMDVLKAETRNASLKLVRFMEEQGKEWQPAASLRELAALSELKRDVVKTLVTMEKELDLATVLAKEGASLAVESLHEEDKALNKLGSIEESLRMSTEVAVLLVDAEAAVQTARLSSNRRLAESLAALNATKTAEREGEAAEVARIKARGAEARRQTQAVVDETLALVGSVVLSAVSDPAKLVKIMASLLGVVFVGLLVGNSVSLAARVIRRRVTKPRLVRETDLPGSPAAAVAAWVTRQGRAILLPLIGKSRRCSGLDPMSPDALEGLVLPSNLEQRLRVIATSIRSAYGRGAPLPHVLIHGAPGSGKSVLARRLAKMCDLKTVVIAGGDVGSLGRSASSELSGLMRWAGSSGGGGDGGSGGSGGGGGMLRRVSSGPRGKGVVVVMDEAEAALGDRRKKAMSENARSALNAVLLCTGELRAGFLMVLTTSRPQDLDEAVLDRVDEVIELPKPGLPERARLIRQYFSAYLHHDPPTDFLQPPAAAEASLPSVASTGMAGEGARSGAAAAVARRGHDEHKSSFHGASRPKGLVPSLNPEMEGEAESCPPVVERRAGKSTRGNRRKGGRACDGVMHVSGGFRDKSRGLMAMLAVRSEGFYGRDMAHFFSAVQAAVFATEDCELTEGVWATTERQKLEEFSTKASMTAAPATIATTDRVTATINAGSRVKSINGFVQPGAFTTAETTVNAGATSEAEMGSTETSQPGVSSVSPCAAAAVLGAPGTEKAAPFHSSSLGPDGGGGSVVPPGASQGGETVVRERSNGNGYHPAATATTTNRKAAAAGTASRHAPTSESAGSDGDTGSEVEVEVEAVGCGVSLPLPNDPEITHPQRVTE